jgi:two-component system uhpT operon response regulator UhpA
MIRVVLVDDHVVVRSGFAQLLGLEEDLSVSGQYSTAAEAWPALLKTMWMSPYWMLPCRMKMV